MAAPTSLKPEWLKVPEDVNGLTERIWPSGFHRDEDGEAVIGGVPISDLTAQFGTPVYVIDQAQFEASAKALKRAFSGATIYYAGKALLSTEIVRWVDALGLNLDVASGGELAIALAAGIDPKRIGLHGNNKSAAEIGRAVSAGVGAIVIDSEIEIERIAATAGAQGRVQPVRIRVNTGVHADTHEFLATAREDQKFGIAMEDVPSLVAKIRSLNHLEFLGLHSHIGSQIFSENGFLESVNRLVKLHAELLVDGPIPQLNLGGGFGINYNEGDHAPAIETFASAILEAVSAACAEEGIEVPHLAFEPGRAVVGRSGITLYTVGTIKDVRLEGGQVRKYVSVDGGMSDNLRTAMYGAEYTTRLVSRNSTAEPALSRVVGKHCESGDIVVRHDYLPADITNGDILAVAATGAYCFSLSSNYNYLQRPPVVAVADGKARLIVRGETEADLLSRDACIAKDK